MRILIDTNVFIPLEPTAISNLEETSQVAAELIRTAQDVGAIVYLHPVQVHDLDQDKNEERRLLREFLFTKYAELPDPPEPTAQLLNAFGDPRRYSNHWIDCHLLAAAEKSAVNLLVTEDRQLRKRAARVGLASRCLSLECALALLDSEKIRVPPALPAVQAVRAHNLNETDPIFDSIRRDYQGFDEWLRKCREKHRLCWVVKIGARSNYAGVAIVDPQDPPFDLLEKPCLKICTFKIADGDTGFKLGELLLRASFDFAHENEFASAFIESSPSQSSLLYLLSQFGFQELGTKAGTSDELVLGKRFSVPTGETDSLDPVEFNRRYGPFAFSWNQVSSYVVPIEPEFHDALFPDLANTTDLWTAPPLQ